ncbi:ArsR family transcriptional regulator [Amycolatopsis sp. cmx-4-68]|uniref:ArsR/SmtB family transcription factor n=1 Tax=Amycolatopsis sp. cmx-4-68 TaxID=2790938 RepID=UPI00397DC6CB
MIELVLGTLDLAKVRFARSPMEELRNSVYVLTGRRGADLHRPWVSMARPRLAGLDLTVLFSLLSIDHGFPGFLNPLTEPGETFDDQLERVRATDDAGVRCYFEFWAPAEIPPVLRPLNDDPGRALGPFCDLLAEYWRAAIEPVWARLCSLHEADLVHRSATLTGGGLARLFADLHPQLEYADDRLRVLLPHHDVQHTVNGVGVLLKPSAFIWPKLSICDGHDQVSIGYPARGIGGLWAQAPPVERTPLANLVGRSRAALLALLDLPRSTTELAEQLGVTPATVSEHLAVLRTNNLVRSRRAGRVVLYERTPRGAGLVRGDSVLP